MIPSLANSPTKEKIIDLISENSPITARKIYWILRKDNKISISYQAIHKALQELMQNNILEKSPDGYQIDKNWIKKLSEFSKRIEEGLDGKNKKNETKTMRKIVFENHSDYIKFT